MPVATLYHLGRVSSVVGVVGVAGVVVMRFVGECDMEVGWNG